MGRIKNFIRNVNYLTKHSLWDQREEDIVYLSNKILDDGIYEYNLDIPEYKKIKIRDKKESLERIIETGKSFVRFGDGEVRLMMGLDQPFQRYEKELVDRLMDVLANPRDNLLVALNRDYYVPGYRFSRNTFMRRNAYGFRMFFQSHCNLDTEYIDAACTFYSWGDRSKEAYDFWAAWKNSFKGRDIVIVCGDHILDKLEYDVFEKARSKKFIYGPRINAWDEHDRLIEEIKKVDIEATIVFILGMAGKAMIPEISEMGYIAWDVGHLAKSYNAFMTSMPITEENISKFYAPD